jgi:hypothetical protein
MYELPEDPSCIVVSVSGGVDSDASAIWARQRWPQHPIILWHSLLAGMDWEETEEHLDLLCERLGNSKRITVQAVYELIPGQTTPTGFPSTSLRRVHDVTQYSHATDDDPLAITNLLDFTLRARNGMPPTSKLRYCTSYFKGQVFDAWGRANRQLLGERAVLLSGERWAESKGRSELSPFEHRLIINPGSRIAYPDGWHLLWHRPVIALKLHQVTQMVVDFGLPLHPGYAIQGETIDLMLNPFRPEKARARLSCICCIFTRPAHLAAARRNSPLTVEPRVKAIRDFEARTGMTWQQSGSIDQEVKPQRSVQLRLDC